MKFLQKMALLLGVVSLSLTARNKATNSDRHETETVVSDSGKQAVISPVQPYNPTPLIVQSEPEKDIQDYISLIAGILLVVLEGVLRFLPTTRNYSILRVIIWLLELLPNRGVDAASGKRMLFKVKTDKQLIPY